MNENDAGGAAAFRGPSKNYGRLVGARIDSVTNERFKETHLQVSMALGDPRLSTQELMLAIVERCVHPDAASVSALAADVRAVTTGPKVGHLRRLKSRPPALISV